jgi:hypothetical protein
MEPELGKIEPINYARNIKPILTKCYACHQGKTGSPPTDTSYGATEKYSFYFMSDGSNVVAGHGGSRSKPGQIGARGSRMGKALMSNTHKQAQTDGKFAETDVRALVQWLDLGSDELGAFDNAATQRQGQLVWPTMDVDKNDPQGLKYDCEGRPCPTGTGGTGGTRASSTSQGTGGSGGGTPAGGSPSGGTGAGGAKATSTSQSGGAGAGGSTSAAASHSAGGASAGGSKATTDGPSGGASGEGSKGTGAGGGQSGSHNASASEGGSQSDASGAGTRGSASSGPSNPSPATAQASSGGCSMGTDARAPAHTLLLIVIGLALLVRNCRKR